MLTVTCEEVRPVDCSGRKAFEESALSSAHVVDAVGSDLQGVFFGRLERLKLVVESLWYEETAKIQMNLVVEGLKKKAPGNTFSSADEI